MTEQQQHPTREQIAEAHKFLEHSAGDGHTSPREWWTTCSCGASLTQWQQGYDENDDDPNAAYAMHIADVVLALFPQPTPSAGADDEDMDDEEFCARCYAGVDSSEHHEKCVVTGHADDRESAPAALPSIADMAPGTTACADPNVNRWYCQRGSDGTCPLLKCIDPSTIRDVTPPPATPEEVTHGRPHLGRANRCRPRRRVCAPRGAAGG
jgi:hypothetical protein